MRNSRLKIIVVLICVSITLSVFPSRRDIAAVVSKGSCGTSATWSLSDDGTLTIAGSGAMKNFWGTGQGGGTYADDVPWRNYRSNIKKVVFSGKVTSVGGSAFSYCRNLSSVSLNGYVTSIGESAFSGCRSLEEITIPSGVKSIGSGAFYESGLTSITIPSGVTAISNSLFENCMGLTEVTIKGNVTSIGYAAFSWTSIYDITIPSTTKTIGGNAFLGCTNLTGINIPSSVTSIGYGAFGDCVSLTSISIPDGIKTIEDGVFQGDYELVDVSLPDSVTSIGECAFNQCYSLKKIVIPNSVTSIGEDAFRSCDNLKSVVLNKNAYSELAFPELSKNIFHYYYDVTYTNDGNGTINGKTKTYGTDVVEFSITPKTDYVLNKVTLTDLNKSVVLAPDADGRYTLPDADTQATIKASFRPENMGGSCGTGLEWAYDGNDTLTITGSGDMNNWTTTDEVPWKDVSDKIKTVYISGNVTSIGDHAFGDCTSLETVYFDNTEDYWKKINIGADNDSLIASTIRLKYTITVLPAQHGKVDVSAKTAYSGEEILIITSPDTGYIVDQIKINGAAIPDDKFYMPSENVEVSVTFREPVTSGTCGTNLTWVFDDGRLTITGSGNMNNWSSLNEVPWKDVRSQIWEAVLPDNLTSIGNYAFANCRGIDYIEIPDSVTDIGFKAFDHSGLCRVVIPDGVISIGDSAFGGCGDLDSIALNKGIYRPGAFPDLPSTAFHYYYDVTYTSDGHGTVTGKARTYGTEVIKLQIVSDNRYSIDKVTLTDSNRTVELTPYSIGHYEMPDMDTAATLSVSFRNSVEQGACGDNLTWSFTGDTLTISGTGPMYDFTGVGEAGPGGPNDDCPWKDCRSWIVSVEFTGNVTSIGDYAFTGCTELKSITIPESVTSIGASAFSECAFTSFVVPDTVKKFETSGAFSGCKFLNSITLPAGITKIGWGMFSGCTNLKNVYYPKTITEIEGRAFENCKSLTGFEIPNTVTDIGRSAFEGCTALKNINVPDSVTSIGEMAFYGCKSLKKIQIPGSVENIGDAAFQGCGVVEITILNGTASISASSFKDCQDLKKVVLPDDDISIGEKAFANNQSLNSVVLNKSSYNEKAFTGCSGDIFHYYYDVSYSNDGHGTVTGKKRSFGTDVLEVEVVPDDGYVIDKITVTSEGKTTALTTSTGSQAASLNRISRASNKAVFANSRSKGNTYSCTMPDSDNGAVIKVTFKKLHSVKYTENANGKVSFSKTSACAGEEIKITVTPASCYETGVIKVNGEPVTDNKFTMPDADAAVEVTFNELPHDLTRIATKEATCTDNGSIEHWKCTKCGQLFRDSEGKEKISASDIVIDALGHDLKCHEETPPTKEAAGNFEYYECDRCHKCFEDAKGTKVVSKEDMTIPAMKHDLTHVKAKAATCTEDGNVEYYECKDADCLITTGGCGKKYSDKYGLNEIDDVTIHATGHHTEKVGAKDPTCTEEGNTEYWKCSVCGHLFKDQQASEEIKASDTVIAALGHDPKHIEAKDPTYLKDGNKEHYECQRDGCHKKFWDAECKNEAPDKEIIEPALGAAVLDEEASVGNLIYKVTYPATDGTGTVSVIGVENKTASVTIPATVEIKESTYKVNRIAAKAFYGNKVIKVLSIGTNVRYIDNYAFYGCSNLVKVSGGKQLESIGTNAFAYCKKLKTFSISSTVLKKIGAYAFKKDKKLKTVYIKYTTRLTKAGVKKSLKSSLVKTVKVKKAKVKAYKKIFKKSNSGRRVKVKK